MRNTAVDTPTNFQLYSKTTIYKTLVVFFCFCAAVFAGAFIVVDDGPAAFGIFLLVLSPFICAYGIYLSVLLGDLKKPLKTRAKVKHFYVNKLSTIQDYVAYLDDETPILAYKSYKLGL